MIRFFAYGTLRRRGRLRALAGNRPVGPRRAVLHGYRKVETPFGYPIILAEEGSSVTGFLWELAKADLDYLDRYEGAHEEPPYYFRVLEKVTVDGCQVDAFVYVGNPERFVGMASIADGNSTTPAEGCSREKTSTATERVVKADTLAAHGKNPLLHPPEAIVGGGFSRPLSPHIAQTSVYTFDSLEELDDVWRGQTPGYIYARMGSPNVEALQATVAALEEGEAGLVASAGTSAIVATLLACLEPGDHVVATREAYGGTHALLQNDFPHRFGVDVSFVDADDLDGVKQAIRPNSRVLYIESLTNPLIRLAPVPELAEVAVSNGLTMVVDNTFATPHLLKPLCWGAHVVVHSATKFLNGHGDVTLGVAAGHGPIVQKARALVSALGWNADPFACWLVDRGSRTLAVRMDRAVSNARQLAHLLHSHPAVERVNYPGLITSPYYERARCLMPFGAGAMLSFTVRGGLAGASEFVRGLRMIRLAPSLGDVTTTVSHPALTSHRNMKATERQHLGIDEGLIRVSVGIEAPEDIAEDVETALNALASE